MILVDTGPIVTVINDRDDHHRECIYLLERLPGPLLGVEPTLGTEPCCTGDRYTGEGGVTRIMAVTFPAAGHAGRWSRSQRTSSRSGTRSSC